jgi:hypothetical protein
VPSTTASRWIWTGWTGWLAAMVSDLACPAWNGAQPNGAGLGGTCPDLTGEGQGTEERPLKLARRTAPRTSWATWLSRRDSRRLPTDSQVLREPRRSNNVDTFLLAVNAMDPLLLGLITAVGLVDALVVSRVLQRRLASRRIDGRSRPSRASDKRHGRRRTPARAGAPTGSTATTP